MGSAQMGDGACSHGGAGELLPVSRRAEAAPVAEPRAAVGWTKPEAGARRDLGWAGGG